MTSSDAEKLVKALHAAGLEGAPLLAAWRETASSFLDVLGHLDAGDVEIARREHLKTSTRWPTPATLLTLVVGDRTPRTMSESPEGGCPDCRWTGWRGLRWVYRQTRTLKLVERKLAATCDCLLGARLHAAHMTPVSPSAAGPGRGPLDTKTAREHCDELDQLPLVALDSGRAGLIAWRCGNREQSTHLGDDVENALRSQAGLGPLGRSPGIPMLDAGPEPVRQDRSARATWHDRPDVDSYDTETQGAWA